MSTLLDIRGLTVKFPTRFGEFTALDSVDLSVLPGQIHGLVGESGAGKSTVGAAVIGLLQRPGHVAGGSINFDGTELVGLPQDEHHRLRGNRISMIFQDPQTSLNPLLTINEQLVETIRQHTELSHNEAHLLAVELLEETGIHDAKKRILEYPHQFSGGMRQRVVIALALCTNPDLIIADEPTTALDVSVQKQILKLISELTHERKIGVILITHDIGVINEVSDKVTVLRSGRVIEHGTTSDVLGYPKDDYTKALMAAVPRLDKRLHRFSNIVSDDPLTKEDTSWQVTGADAAMATSWLLSSSITKGKPKTKEKTPTQPAMLSVNDLSVTFYSEKPGWIFKPNGFVALQGLNFSMRRGEVLGVVGESGSGKSTLAKAIVGLVDPSAGTIQFRGQDLPPGTHRSRKHPARREIQMVFQDPYSSLNNRRSVEDILSEPVRFYGLSKDKREIRKLIASVLELVEMPHRAMLKYPHQFSGGQRQRIAIARALIARPEFLICDEPTSALDVSIQAQLLNLLKDLQETFGLSILFISHNLAVIRQMTDRVIVLKQGKMIESADTESFFASPSEDYSRSLLKETPSLVGLSDQ